jgi:hypothetical protein
MGDAADFLGINPAGGQYAITKGTYQWLSDQAPDRFTKALRDMAARLDPASGLTDYRRRREALRNWSLAPGTWHEITTSLPPVPGPVRPSLDDRKRQEASVFIWASPEASRCSLPGSSRPASLTTSAGPGSCAAAVHGFNSGVLTRSTTMQPCGRA